MVSRDVAITVTQYKELQQSDKVTRPCIAPDSYLSQWCTFNVNPCLISTRQITELSVLTNRTIIVKMACVAGANTFKH